MKTLQVLYLFMLVFLTGCSVTVQAPDSSTPVASVDQNIDDSLIRVKVSSQTYSYVRPWDTKTGENREGLGVIVKQGLVMVTAQLVADSTYIELEKGDSGLRSPAHIVEVDYRSNMALLGVNNSSFLQGKKPVPIRDNLAAGDKVEVLLSGKDGKYERLQGSVSGIDMGGYPYKSELMLSKIKVSLPAGTDASSIVIVKDGAICGFGMGYRQNSETVRAISVPVLHHFLNDYNDGKYEGLPFMGIDFSPLDDVQLREYLKMGKENGGIYIYRVRPASPVAKAGLKPGDVLVAMDGQAVNKFGKYKDDVFGLTNLSHYISTRKYSGEFVFLSYLRDGVRKSAKVRLKAVSLVDTPVPTYLEGAPPKYMILGGLVITELSRQYLQEWGPQWVVKSPENLVHYYLNQWKLLKPGQRLVILSHVLPTRAMIGYTEFSNMIVNMVNGQTITKIEDVSTALQHPIGQFHHLTFKGNSKEVFLNRYTLEKENVFIQRRYGISSLQRL